MSQPPPESELLTFAEAARIAGISRQALESAILSGTLEAVEIQVKAYRLRRADVLAHVARTEGTVGRPRGA